MQRSLDVTTGCIYGRQGYLNNTYYSIVLVSLLGVGRIGNGFKIELVSVV